MEEKIYRPNVAAIILSCNYPRICEFFLAERCDLKGIWQFPQGGIDKGESPKEALFRELKEEIGTNNIEVIAEHPEWVQYDFPKDIARKMVTDKGYPFDGQIQKYFLVRLKDNFININTPEPEFCNYEFVDFPTMMTRINHFKKHAYKQVLTYFKKGGYI
ncbi:RNA pyrophosphohydrolase [Helicobacter sp. 13S00401-1]|uniref:RNA pyrophosphohydrolase n=1 Tax=Helicobacter sp. 13S00401-1 TaxID=1905758 RepID=UPI000BA52161|nr:RNA pyrophosphohydrolase [Helicobacter sp. 13S00401-1]PAF48985.1 RNA pyrophosphohydrolase [Helicobacter sp. 13S00401-1]